MTRSRLFVFMGVLTIVAVLLSGCPAPTPQIIEVPKEVVVEKIVKETVEVIKEVVVEKIVKETVEVEVEVEKEVIVEVEIPMGSSAQRAIDAAKQYAGTTITYVREAGLQVEDPLAMAPIFEELTGIKVEVVGLPYLDIYSNALQDHLTGGGAYDALDVSPIWMRDFVSAGVLEPLDPYIDEYMNKADLDDYLPVYSSEGVMKIDGVTYGLYDDGDVFMLYYRKDLFEDADNQAEFKAAYGYDLVPPETNEQLFQVAEFFTNKHAPDMYGYAAQRIEGQAYSWFIGPFSGAGGEFFDTDTMTAQINSDVGVQTLTQLVQQNTVMPPGVEKWGFMEVLSAWLDNKVAMITTWPPIGRWSAGYGDTAKQLEWVPPSQVKDKVGYMLQPGGRPTLAGGFNLAVSADSKNKEAAYLWIQWMTSPEISLQRVMLPFTLRDPFRLSHFDSPLYRSAWPDAGEYLDTLRNADTGQWELGIPGAREYMEAIDIACTSAYAGKDPKAAMDEAAARWDEITDRLGVDSQKEHYNKWLTNPWNKPGPTVDLP